MTGVSVLPQRPLDIAALKRDLQARVPGHPVKLVETHISWVLLCGKLAYKLKKPVRLGFLDFGTAEARRGACEDVMSDVAFMVMDLVAQGRRDLAFRFLDVWLERTGDRRGITVLRYYLVYRALVRALVATLGPPAAAGGESVVPDYIATAHALAVGRNPRLLITYGTSGSGKTFVSRRVLEHAGAIRVRSDVERKRLFGLQALQHSASFVHERIYGADATRRTYDTLHERARLALEAGYPTIVDATFLLRRERAMFEELAAELNVPFAILHCHAPDAVLRQRIAARQAGQRDASEADAEVLRRQLEACEPLLDDELAHVIDVDSTAAIDVTDICARWQRSGPAAAPARRSAA